MSFISVEKFFLKFLIIVVEVNKKILFDRYEVKRY